MTQRAKVKRKEPSNFLLLVRHNVQVWNYRPVPFTEYERNMEFLAEVQDYASMMAWSKQHVKLRKTLMLQRYSLNPFLLRFLWKLRKTRSPEQVRDAVRSYPPLLK